MADLFDWRPRLNAQQMRSDLSAGLTGAIIALPQCVAYALIAGMPPETGLYSAIIVTALAALLGSSWHMISGPAAAVSIVLMSIVSGVAEPGSADFIATMFTLTLITGVIQLLLGLMRVGSLVNFISHTVVIGFTAGASILIAASQFKYLLGVTLPGGLNLFETLYQLWLSLGDTHLYSLLVGIVTLLSAIIIRRINRRLPHLLIALGLGSLTAQLLGGSDSGIANVGALPSGLPLPALPELSLSGISTLASGAFALALLGLIEAVSIGRAIALRSHQQINGNREFVAQGVANSLGSFFSCFAGSGSFTRSGANFDAGAQTPIAALINAATVAVLLISFPSITNWLPMPAMAGSILLIAWNLIDRPHIAQILKVSRLESVVLVSTFAATLLIDPVFSIYVGVFLSIAFYLRRTSRPSVVPVAPLQNAPRRSIRNVERHGLRECPQFQIIRIDGSMFFGCVEHIQLHLRKLAEQSIGPPRILIVGKGINFIDVSAFEMLIQEAELIEARGGQLMFCSMKGVLLDDLERTGLLGRIGSARFFGSTQEAIASVVPELDLEICDRCTARIFEECPPPPEGLIYKE
ncbi:SulP family inorganic anion transporter [Marinobacterium sp. YM272]|uniref:SulP family inorganic anion transporter n=1 Tax=Marinobacterium sp. YM272 TaxID=3421654 RepID=UPI003D7F2B12